MLRRGDERAVTVQIGAVLLLAILFSALALYQLNAVPAENQQVEYTHNQEVRDEMQDLRNAIQNVGTSGGTQSTSVTLGTQYPSRTVAVNPPAARGTLETTGTANISINGQFAGEESDYDGNPHNLTGDHETTTLAYTPEYSEYQSAPTTRIEHGFAFNDFDDAQVSLADQPLVSNDTIRLVTLEGELSKSGTGAVSLDPTVLSGPSDAVPIEPEDGSDAVTVTIPTDAPEVWEDTFADEDGMNVTGHGDGRLTVELTGEDITLMVSRVSIDGSDSSGNEYNIRETPKSTQTGSSGLDLEWTDATVDGEEEDVSGNETTVSGTPGDDVTLTVGVNDYADLQRAQSDFSFTNSENVIEEATFDPDEEFEDGTATVEFAIDSDASADEEATVLVSSGGGLALATITVEEREDRLEISSGESRGDESSGVEFSLQNSGEGAVTVTGISLDETSAAATRVNNQDDREIEVFRDGTVEGWIDTDFAASIDIPSGEQDFESDARFEPGDDGTIVIEQFRDDDWYSAVDMSGHTLTLTLYYETATGTQRSEQVEIEIDPFDVEITDVDDEVTAGDVVEVTTAVTYDGSVERTETIEFLVDGELVETRDVTLAAGDGETVSFAYETDEDDVPELTTTVRSDADSDSRTVAVEPQTLSIDDLTITDESGNQVIFDVDWAVSDDDGNLETVRLSLENEAEDEVDDDEIDVEGAEASGTTELGETGNPDAQEYTITLTVSDGETDLQRTETVDYAG